MLRPAPHRPERARLTHSVPHLTGSLKTLIETAEMKGLDTQAWLAEVLHHIPKYPSNRIDELLPWNWKPDNALSNAA